MASGLMILLLNKATSLSGDFMGLAKEYEVEMIFGLETDTMDMEGRVLNRIPVDSLDARRLEKIIKRSTGDIEQVPPMYSAVKHRGKPLYKLARRGISVERKPRQVHIREITIKDIEKERLTLNIVCSSGTYIRTVAHDMGKSYGTGAVVSCLRRMRIGDMSVDSAAGILEIRDISRCGRLPRKSTWIISLQDFFSDYPSLTIKGDQILKVKNGSRLSPDMLQEKNRFFNKAETGKRLLPGIITVKTGDGRIAAIHRVAGIKGKDTGESEARAFTKSVVIF